MRAVHVCFNLEEINSELAMIQKAVLEMVSITVAALPEALQKT